MNAFAGERTLLVRNRTPLALIPRWFAIAGLVRHDAALLAALPLAAVRRFAETR